MRLITKVARMKACVPGRAGMLPNTQLPIWLMLGYLLRATLGNTDFLTLSLLYNLEKICLSF